MDIELLHLDSDKISDFLVSKLEGIKAKNVELEEFLHKRQEKFSECLQLINKNEVQQELHITEALKKIANSKYVLSFHISGGNRESAKAVSVTLNWNSSSPLRYSSFTLPVNSNPEINELTSVDVLPAKALVMVVLPIPLFIEQLTYVISGFITFKNYEEKFILNLPSVTLDSKDVADNNICVDIPKIIDGKLNDFLAHIFSQNKYEFIFTPPLNFDYEIETAFKVTCSLIKVNLVGQKATFYVADRISKAFDGSVLEIIKLDCNSFNFFVYSNSEESLLSLIHHIKRNLPDVEIIPKQLLPPESNGNEALEKIKDPLSQELDCISSTVHNLNSREQEIDFRRRLAILEETTDIALSLVKSQTVQ